MTTPQITIHDAITGEIITRDFNDDELAQLEKNKAQALANAQIIADKQIERQIVLDKLGLTANEVAILFS